MKSKMFVAILGVLVAAGAALAQQPARARMHPMMMKRGTMFFNQLKLTDQQKAEAQKIKLNIMQKQIDVRANIAHARIDYQELASAADPDQKALSAKLEDIAKLKGQLRTNMLDGWFAINKILTPEQQKTWKKVLEHPMMFRHNRGAGIWGDRMGNGRMMMNRIEIMRNGPGMHGNWNTWGRQNMWNRQARPSPDTGK